MARGLQPKKAVDVGGQFVTLCGNLAAMEAYEDITGGYDLFHAWDRVRDRLIEYEETGKSRRMPSGLVAELLWSFSATWRLQHGWDDEDDLHQPPRKRESFQKFSAGLGMHDYQRLSPILLGLLLDVFTPPLEAVPEEEGDEDRPEPEALQTTTGT